MKKHLFALLLPILVFTGCEHMAGPVLTGAYVTLKVAQLSDTISAAEEIRDGRHVDREVDVGRQRAGAVLLACPKHAEDRTAGIEHRPAGISRLGRYREAFDEGFALKSADIGEGAVGHDRQVEDVLVGEPGQRDLGVEARHAAPELGDRQRTERLARPQQHPAWDPLAYRPELQRSLRTSPLTP